MKKIYSKLLLIVVLMAGLCACKGNGNTPEQPKVDYDKMVGTWTLNSWEIKQVNTDENIVEVDSIINQGQITIRKGQVEDGYTKYPYTENFLSINGGEYEGVILIENGMINLCKEDGFNRQDMEYNFEYTVSFPADNKMEWSYDWKGAHTRGGVTHQDHRTVKAIFTKQ